MPEELNKKIIYIVRHGESLGNVERFSQLAETPLTDRGHKQAEVLAERCRHLDFELLLASDMVRAQETAKHIGDVTGQTIVTDSVFREKDTPHSVRGKSRESEEYKYFIQGIENNIQEPNWFLPGAESHNAVITRADQAVDFILARPEKSILLVTHGTFMQYLVTQMLFTTPPEPEIYRTILSSFHPDNTGITVCENDGSKWRLITWNDRAHFAE